MPAGAAITSPYGYTKGSAAPFGASGGAGPFVASEFFASYISCADWMSMTPATRTRTMSGYFAHVRGPFAALTPQQRQQQQEYQQGYQTLVVGRPWVLGIADQWLGEVEHAVAAANAYCFAQNPSATRVSTPPAAPHVSSYLVRPAGQTAAPSSGISGWTIIGLLAVGFVVYEVGSYYLAKAKEDVHRGRRAHYRY